MTILAAVILCELLVFQAAPVQQAQELIEKLNSESVKERDLAVRKLRDIGSAALPELRTGATENLYLSDQAFVYRRGPSVVALNNDTTAAEIRLPGVNVTADALGLCAPARRIVNGVILTVPARTGCVFRHSGQH